MNICPQCGNQLPQNANICPFCGFDLRISKQNPVSSPYSYTPAQGIPSQAVPPTQPYHPPPVNTASQSPSFSSYPSMVTEEKDTFFYLSIAGLVLGVINLCSWILPICGCPLSLTGGIVSGIGLKSKNKTMAIIGISLNGIGFILSILNSIFGFILGLGRQ